MKDQISVKMRSWEVLSLDHFDYIITDDDDSDDCGYDEYLPRASDARVTFFLLLKKQIQSCNPDPILCANGHHSICLGQDSAQSLSVVDFPNP